MSKTQQYVARLLKERPTHTPSGVPIEISDSGYTVRTFSGRDWHGNGYSVYCPTDYPRLFGWDREPSLQEKLDLVMDYLGLEFEYIPSHLKVVKRKKS